MDNNSTAATSPKLTKKHSLADIRFPSPGAMSSYGCDHVKSQLENSQQETVKRYTTLTQTIHKNGAITPHLSKSAVSLRPTFLCLQCSSVFNAEQRSQHEAAHSLCVESSNGHVFCRECDDFVYDNTFEEIRSQQGKKRKHAVYISDVDNKILAANALSTPCRARGLRGLYNMGQTCFMSVVLQSLIHNPFIRSYYLSVGHKSNDCEREACTSCALDDIFTEFHSTEKAEGYGAVAMLQGSWKGGGNLAGYQQQDAHEYLQFILNSLHTANIDEEEKEEKAEDCACVIHRTFCGQMKSTVVCSKCKNLTTAVDPFMDLSLDLKPQGGSSAGSGPNNKTKKNNKNETTSGASSSNAHAPIDLKECLDRFTSTEVLQAADYRCRECDSQQNATKKLALSRLPPVLPIHLKRFSHSKSLSTSIKLDTKVRFPTVLDLQPYTSRVRSKKGASAAASAAVTEGNGEGKQQTQSHPRPVYELSSVIVHKGRMDSGHYVSYAREGDEWFLFDDSKVVLVDEKEVLGAEAYMLFYVVQEIEV